MNGNLRFAIHHSPPCVLHATNDTPPAMYALTGVHAGPLCERGLNQNAVKRTCDPAGVAESITTSTRVRVVDPSNFQRDKSAGGVAPTKLNNDAPFTPAGFEARSNPIACRRTFSVRPCAATISNTGDSVGGLIGVTVPLRGVSPRSIRCVFVIAGKAFAIRAYSRAKTFKALREASFAAIVPRVRVLGSVAVAREVANKPWAVP